jgi:branched-chain amino acid aminotransferase
MVIDRAYSSNETPLDLPGVVNFNGVITPIGEGRISVLDHGFLFGDNVYETLRTYSRKPFLLTRHFERLQRSARTIFLDLPWDLDTTRNEVLKTLRAANFSGESRIRITITRGAGDMGLDPGPCTSPNAIVFATPLKELSSEVYENGVEIIVSSLQRSRQLGEAKTGNLLRSVLASRETRVAGAFEAITLTSDGKVSDGITSNIYLVQGRRLLTPSIDAGILEGITRAVVLDLARRIGLEVVEGLFDMGEVARSDELFLTSSTREIVPIVRVAGKTVGNGRPGPVTLRLLEAYRGEIEVLLKEE